MSNKSECQRIAIYVIELWLIWLTGVVVICYLTVADLRDENKKLSQDLLESRKEVADKTNRIYELSVELEGRK